MSFLKKVKDNYRITASTFTQQLNLKFADILRSKDFQKIVIRDAEEYRNEQTDEEMLERAFDELYPDWMQELERRGTFIGNGLEVYRGISVKEESDINYDKLGVYWTWDKEKAANYSDINTSTSITILTALVSINDIDLEATLSKVVWAGYDSEESEREITLKPNTKLKILAPMEKEATASIKKIRLRT